MEAQKTKKLQAKGGVSPQIVGVSELAKHLLVPKVWIYSHMGTLPHFKVGRYSRFVLEEVMESLRAASPGKKGNQEVPDVATNP